MIKRLTLILLICFLVSSGFSQSLEVVHTKYTTSEGLPSNEVYHSLQDSKGYMWFATDNGVSRYNGKQFINYGLRENLPDLTIFKLYEDKIGRIWFGSRSGKLSYYLNDSIHQFKYNDTLSEALPQNPIILSFIIDSVGDIYLGLTRKGCLIINSETGKIQHWNKTKNKRYAGNAYFLPVGMDIITYTARDVEEGETPAIKWADSNKALKSKLVLYNNSTSGNVVSIKDRDGVIYIAYNSNLVTVYPNGIDTITEAKSDVISFQETRDRKLWAGLRNGLTCLSDSTQDRHYGFLVGVAISSITEDSEGGFWCTTLTKGVFYMSNRSYMQYNDQHELGRERVNVVQYYNGVVHLGLNNGSVIATKKTEGRVLGRANMNIDENKAPVLDLLIESENNMYVAFPGLVTVQHPKVQAIFGKTKCSITPIPCKSINQSNDGTIWGAHSSGACQFISQKLIYRTSDEFPDFAPTRMMEVGNTLWIGSIDGLYKYKQDSLIYLGDYNPLFKNRIYDLDTFKNELVLSISGEGLAHIPTNNIDNTYLSFANADDIIDIDATKNGLWISTNNSIGYLNSELEYSGFLKVSNSEIHDISVDSNVIWMATSSGLKRLTVDFEVTMGHERPIFITSLNIDYNSTNVVDSITLSSNQNNIKIGYESIDFGQLNGEGFEYRLLGNNHKWMKTNDHWVQFSALAPGSYKFEIKPTENESRFASMSFVVLPPYWRTWWFASLLILMASLSIYFFFKIRVLTYNRDVIREILFDLYRVFDKKVYVVVRADGFTHKIDPYKIKWIRVDGNYVDIFTTDKKLTIRTTLLSLKGEIPVPELFVQIHRSYLVNRKRVDSVGKTTVVIENDELPIGRTYQGRLQILEDGLIVSGEQ